MNCHFFQLWYNDFIKKLEEDKEKEIRELKKSIQDIEKDLFVFDLINIIKKQKIVITSYKEELKKFITNLQ